MPTDRDDETPLWPLFLDLRGRRALLVGHGEAAERRAASLLACGAVLIRAERFEPVMLDGCAIAIGAAEEPVRRQPEHKLQQALRAMSAEARRRGIPCNVVDQPDLSSFISPAIVSRPPLAIAISTDGKAPVLARLLRARIEAAVPPAFGRLAALAGRLQQETRERLAGLAPRRQLLEQLLAGPIAELVFAGREAEAEAAWRQALEASLHGEAAQEPGTRASFTYLLPLGSSDPDLLTLRALRVMGEADAVVHDPAESPAILEVARRDAARYPAPSGAATALLLRLAAVGGRIVRLRPGPDEPAALERAGLAHATVPCVSAGGEGA